MKQVEIEDRYLVANLPENALASLVGDEIPTKELVYANFSIDKAIPKVTVKFRSQNMPLRSRLIGATELDVQAVMSGTIMGRLKLLNTLRGSRATEYTLKVPATTGRKELETIKDIAEHLKLGKAIRTEAAFSTALKKEGLGICLAVLTDRKEWNLGSLTEHAELIVTRDTSRCHHQLADGVSGRDIIEVEACVLVANKTSAKRLAAITKEAELALHTWIRSKLGELPKTVVGSATVCIIAHTPKLGREMVQKKAIKPNDLTKMLRNGELTNEAYHTLIGA